MNKVVELRLSNILKIVLLLEAAFLLFNAAALSRDYQDIWILEGLELPFMLFVATYAVVFFSEKKVGWMVVLATLSISTLTLIPALKYVWFTGRNIDQLVQYNMASHIRNQGHLISSEYLGQGVREWYTTTPGIQLSFASFSIVTGIPLQDSFKFLPIVLSVLCPLMICVTVRELGLSKETKVLKYALFLSSLLFLPALSYIVSGTMWGVILAFFVLAQTMKLVRTRRARARALLLLFFTFALVMAHSFSAVIVALLIVGISIMQRFPFARVRSFIDRSLVLLVLFLNLGWLLFRASNTLRYMTFLIRGISLLGGASPETGYVPVRFFQLLSTDMFETIKTFLAIYGVTVFFLLLMAAGVVVIASKGPRSNTLRLLLVSSSFILLFLLVGLGLGIGAFYWHRVIRFTVLSCAAFFGILVAYVERTRLRSILAILFLIAVVVLTPLEFGCQPIIGPASVLSPDLPADEPIIYVGQVNSVYQRNMIDFGEHYARGRIASDGVTRNQIIGLTNVDFSTRYLAWFYPLSESERSEGTSAYYDYFFMHLPGKSGAFEEQAEERTRNVILATLNDLTHNVVYSNEQSYILRKTSSP